MCKAEFYHAREGGLIANNPWFDQDRESPFRISPVGIFRGALEPVLSDGRMYLPFGQRRLFAYAQAHSIHARE